MAPVSHRPALFDVPSLFPTCVPMFFLLSPVIGLVKTPGSQVPPSSAVLMSPLQNLLDLVLPPHRQQNQTSLSLPLPYLAAPDNDFKNLVSVWGMANNESEREKF